MKERLPSRIWDHFTRLTGPESRASCNYCGISIKFPGSHYGNLYRHLKVQHKEIEIREYDRKNSFREIPITEEETKKKKEANHKCKRETTLQQTTNIWDHFSRPAGLSKRAKCNYCEKILSEVPLGNLRRHLRRMHKIDARSQIGKDNHLSLPLVTEEASSTNEEENIGEVEVSSISFSQEENQTSFHPLPESSLEMASPSRSPLPDQDSPSPLPDCDEDSSSFKQLVVNRVVKVKNPIPPNKIQALDIQFTKMIFKVSKECHPFSLVKEDEFKQFVEMLCPGYDLPGKKKLNESLIQSLYRTTSDELKSTLSQATAICITLDSWTSIKNNCFYAIIAHYIDQDMKLHSNLIECSEFEGGNSATDISDWLDEVFKNWNFRNKIVAGVIDNSANIITAFNTLSINYISCYSHSLNMIIQNAIDNSINNVVNKVESIVKYFKRNSTALTKLEEKKAKINKSQFNLDQDIPPNWNSTFEKLNGLLRNKKSIISTLALLYTKNLSKFETREWEVIKHTVILLEFFEEVKREIRPDKNVSLSETCILTRVLLRRVEKFLFEMQETMLPNEVTKLGNLLLEGLNKKFGDRENSELISQSLFLDPRFKKQGFGDKDKYRTTYDALTEKMREMNTFPPSQPTSHNTQLETQGKSNSLWKDFDAKIEQQYAISDTIVELNKYIAEPIMHRTSDPLAWWRERKSVYPNLYEIARQHLCIPAISVPCERLQMAEQTLKENISGTTSSKVTQMLFLNSNM